MQVQGKLQGRKVSVLRAGPTDKSRNERQKSVLLTEVAKFNREILKKNCERSERVLSRSKELCKKPPASEKTVAAQRRNPTG